MGKDNKLFSGLIFEAKVVSVDYPSGTCAINPNSASPTYVIDEVPIPKIMGGFGNAGIFGPLYRGTRVIAAQADGRGRESIVILQILSSSELEERSFDNNKPKLTPVGLYSYPRVTDDRVIMRGGRGSEICLTENGDVHLMTDGGGIFIQKNKISTSTSLISEDTAYYTSAGRTISGAVRRMTRNQRSTHPAPTPNEIPLFADPEYSNIAKRIGFFTGSECSAITFDQNKRNPDISEYRMVINEFSTDSMFSGFDDEVLRTSGTISLFDDADTFSRNREQGNTLHLAEHELIEIIGGNVVDINGNILDLNYRKLEYGAFGTPGGPQNSVLTSDDAAGYEIARRVSRRGIGYHFQLSTNTIANDPSSSTTSLLFDIDKEGLIKLNVPASSDTGNIPFSSSANFLGTLDNVDVDYSLKSETEKVPATLRDFSGNVVFPDKIELSEAGFLERQTGIRFRNRDQNPYFPGAGDVEKEFIRVNITKYHNMYAVAERLIANTITGWSIPKPWSDPDGKVEGNSSLRPFERQRPTILDKDENLDDLSSTTKKHQEDLRKAVPTFMSIIYVDPAEPAINSGGDTVVAGQVQTSDEYEPLSNSFSIDPNADFGDPATLLDVPAGGQSAHLNFEGSIVASVGKDNTDGKSIVLDTDGSVISWLGKDQNGRSLVMQTDGEMLINVGGSYENEVMNFGRFELRVNVTDKGFINEEGSIESDIIISLSEEGIIIAGMNSKIPMIIRNDAKILIESSSSEVILKGTSVKIVTPGGEKVLKPPSAGSGSPLT